VAHLISRNRFTLPDGVSPALSLTWANTNDRLTTHFGCGQGRAKFLKRNLPDRWMDAIIFRLVGLPRWVEQQEGE
jgi:hypothetical protein